MLKISNFKFPLSVVYSRIIIYAYMNIYSNKNIFKNLVDKIELYGIIPHEWKGKVNRPWKMIDNICIWRTYKW